MTRSVTLSVNDAPVGLDYFVQSFIDHTLGGMIEALEDTGPIEEVEVLLRGEDTEVILNRQTVRMNSFVAGMLRRTLEGLLSSLKGVGEIDTARIMVSRRILPRTNSRGARTGST